MSELIGVRSLGADLNLKYQIGVSKNATAAIGMTARRGLGEVKHINTVCLRVQEAIGRYKVKANKKHTGEMIAGLLRKPFAEEKLQTF